MIKPLIVSRIIIVWMFIISILLISYVLTIYSEDTKFYRIGPQPDLIIIGFTIDTPEKYLFIVLYAIINTIIRNLDHNIISQWITLNVQNTEFNKITHQYEISITNTIYSWFDWLIYIHMLLAQIDMFLLELKTYVIAIYFVTNWYIKNKIIINNTIINDTILNENILIDDIDETKN
jgi:hypothetical protein